MSSNSEIDWLFSCIRYELDRLGVLSGSKNTQVLVQLIDDLEHQLDKIIKNKELEHGETRQSIKG
jgi:hypothetical protein